MTHAIILKQTSVIEHLIGNAGPEAALTWLLFITVTILMLVLAVFWTAVRVKRFIIGHSDTRTNNIELREYLDELTPQEIDVVLQKRKSRAGHAPLLKKASLVLAAWLISNVALGQASTDEVASQPGIWITVVLILIPMIAGVVILIATVNRSMTRHRERIRRQQAKQLADYLINNEDEELETTLLERKIQLESAGKRTKAGWVTRVSNTTDIPFVAAKKKTSERPPVDPGFRNLILFYLGTAIFWLLFGTTVGEYLGIKFLAPEMDEQSWLSFGRLRPVHTNAVFWGWSSLAMLGLGHYVVPIVSNAKLASIRKGWVALVLINASVLIGSISLMAGINNGGGEYREYVWPITALFGAGLIITFINFWQTIAKRSSREIYISNWYIVAAIMFALVITFIAYWPTWQNGLGETIIQGYYMHQGVGMWFMLFTLGLVYYFLPQQLNKPIYSYSLGIIAFWTQIIFYTVIGTHHFVFSSIPWSLQTIAIVGSMGMVIPVAAGTTNFFMTLKGEFGKIATSYSLPFFLVGIVFYFTGSLQGTAEAFRYTNLLWHFTDFTVAHSHITMYGIIAFLLWGCVYAIVPRLTGKEPSHPLVGAHFWIAFLGLLLYSVPLMIGGTLKGMMWMDGKPFMDSVVMMAPYWLWRAIGGTMMWVSHFIFAYNFYCMIVRDRVPNVKDLALERIQTLETKKETVVIN